MGAWALGNLTGEVAMQVTSWCRSMACQSGCRWMAAHSSSRLLHLTGMLPLAGKIQTTWCRRNSCQPPFSVLCMVVNGVSRSVRNSTGGSGQDACGWWQKWPQLVPHVIGCHSPHSGASSLAALKVLD